MVTALEPSRHPLAKYIHQLEQGLPMLIHSDLRVMEVVWDSEELWCCPRCLLSQSELYCRTPIFKLIPLLQVFQREGDAGTFGAVFGGMTRINYEYAEYCMKSMFWHGGGGLDAYVDTPEFEEAARKAIAARWKNNPLMLGLNKLFPDYQMEQARVMAYYTGLGQFWRVMSDICLSASVIAMMLAKLRRLPM